MVSEVFSCSLAAPEVENLIDSTSFLLVVRLLADGVACHWGLTEATANKTLLWPNVGILARGPPCNKNASESGKFFLDE